MQFIRSLIFNIFLYCWPHNNFYPSYTNINSYLSKFTIFFGRVSAKYIVYLLKIILKYKSNISWN